MATKTVYEVFNNVFFYGGPGEEKTGSTTIKEDGQTITYSAQGYYEVQLTSDTTAPSLIYNANDLEYAWSGDLIRFTGGYPGNKYLYEECKFVGIYSSAPKQLAGDIALPEGDGAGDDSLWYPEQFYVPITINVVLNVTPGSVSKTINLSENSSRVVTNTPLTGAITFADSDTTQRPTARLGTQVVVVTNAAGDIVNLSKAQIASLEAAFTFEAASGNTNKGEIDWTYSPMGIGLDFLTLGKTAVVTSTINISDQDENVETSSVIEKIKGTDEIHLVLNEGANGFGTLTITDNGLPLNINGGSDEVGISFDPTMPLSDGSYNLKYYESGKVNSPCLYVTTIFPDGRTAIEIHRGNSPGDSQGCIVFGNNLVNGTGGNNSYDALVDDLTSIVEAEGLTGVGGGYTFDHPITMSVTGSHQPLLSLVPHSQTVTLGGKATVTVRDGVAGSAPIIDRDIEVFFTISGLSSSQSSLVSGAAISSNGDGEGHFVGDYEITIQGDDSWEGGHSATAGSTSAAFSIDTTGLSIGNLNIQIAGYAENEYEWQDGGDTTEYTPAVIGSQPMLKGVKAATITLKAPDIARIAADILVETRNLATLYSDGVRDAIGSADSVSELGHLFRNHSELLSNASRSLFKQA